MVEGRHHGHRHVMMHSVRLGASSFFQRPLHTHQPECKKTENIDPPMFPEYPEMQSIFEDNEVSHQCSRVDFVSTFAGKGIDKR